MTEEGSRIERGSAALSALSRAVPPLEHDLVSSHLEPAIERGYFRPAEEEHLIRWFARFLSVREALWEVVAEASEDIEGPLDSLEETEDLCCFVLGYAAACLVVRLDRLLVERLATHELVQRKLNEGSLELRIPRKRFTAVFESLSHPRNALLMLDAMRAAERHRERIRSLANDRDVGALVRSLAELETSLDPSRRRYLRSLARFGEHALRRRGASARQKVTFAALKSGGRLVAEIQLDRGGKRVDARVRERLGALLAPGDVLVTRHDGALTNLFLPGYWPHAALYIGVPADRESLGVRVAEERRRRWSGDRCVLEALKDGVRFRPLSETLAVDAVAVLRPRLEREQVVRAIERAVEHEGKLYNFDFDFFRSDRLVCTEVVYRALDGVGEIRLELRQRAGRPTLTAEDLLDAALDGSGLEPMAVYGAPPEPDALHLGESVRSHLAASYRAAPPETGPAEHGGSA